ncbi:cupin domain-containing protein [Defluviimonas sp. SAOS-178_SWC]|uniref:cupin domain-containing protein n=1 Tax=Defluviimonas sp. SAOS-178_SWC TaxID=3121287 RepID=UPI003221D039
MPDTSDHRSRLSREDLERLPEAHIRHPLNPASDVFLKRLSPLFGLQRLALYIARVPPGKESFLYHRHERDEEFLVILSGRGLAEIGDGTVEIGPGDIMAFPAPDGPPHHLTNPFENDLVYFMGGESSAVDVVHFPRTGRHMAFTPSGLWSFGDSTSERLTFSDWTVPETPETS